MKTLNGAKILLRRQLDGKYLILRASLWPENPSRSLQPDFPGGTIESGEKIEDGLVREVQEETGIRLEVSAVRLVHCATQRAGDTLQNFLFYFAQITGDEPIVLSYEHDSYRWLTAAEVLTLEIRQPYPVIFRHLAEAGFLVDPK